MSTPSTAPSEMAFFSLLARWASLSATARELGISTAAASKRLAQMESRLGVQLVSRTTRRLHLTAEGNTYLRHARRILAEAANIRSYAANERGEHRGRLLLATTHTQARYVLPKAIADLSRRFPQVSVDLFAAGDAEVLDKLDEADFGLISTAGGAPTTGGIAVPLFRWRRVLLVQKGHPLAELGAPPTLAELARYPLISYESSTLPDSSLQRAFAAAGVVPQIAMTARDANLIKAYVRTGMGAGLLAEMAVGGREDDDLRVIEAPQALPECITWAVVPRGRVLREYALALLHGLAPQIDPRDLRRVLEGNLTPDWPRPPRWQPA